jgi:hypothetical protein
MKCDKPHGFVDIQQKNIPEGYLFLINADHIILAAIYHVLTVE